MLECSDMVFLLLVITPYGHNASCTAILDDTFTTIERLRHVMTFPHLVLAALTGMVVILSVWKV